MDERTRKSLVVMFGMLVLLSAFLIHRMPTNPVGQGTNQAKMKSGPIVSASFSPWHASFVIEKFQLNITRQEMLRRIRGLGIRKIRFCSPWNGIERKGAGDYSWAWPDETLAICEELGLEVNYPVGAKTPHYPEHHPPGWLEYPSRGLVGGEDQQRVRTAILSIVEATVRRYQGRKCIKSWQPENEPLTASRPIDKGLLEAEVNLIRKLDRGRPIVLSTWTAPDTLVLPELAKLPLFQELVKLSKAEVGQLNPVEIQEQFLGLRPLGKKEGRLIGRLLEAPIDRLVRLDDLIRLGDEIGLDVYAQGYTANIAWRSSEAQFKVIDRLVNELKRRGKPFSILEVQGMGWKLDPETLDLTSKDGNEGFTPAVYQQLVRRAAAWGPKEIGIWDIEYQIAAELKGNPAWIEATKKLLAQYRTE